MNFIYLPRGFRILSEMVSWWLWQMVENYKNKKEFFIQLATCHDPLVIH